MIHRLETNKLHNVAKFFARLFGTDALPWHVLSYIRLTEDDTTSSHNPKNTRFCINFFTFIGLGGLTENLREYLKNMPCLIMQQQKDESGSSDSSDSDAESASSDQSDTENDRSGRKRLEDNG
ncbi:hypothetical protein JHK84_045735 [Glycine max]|nr:hypothetical protein JHK84_045735 [Glycine max]